MKTTSLRARALCCALLAGTAYCGLASRPAAAQTSVYDLPEKLVDANGVDLPAARLLITFPTVEFGEQVRLKADYYARFPEAGASVPSAMYAFDFVGRPATGGSGEELTTGWSPLGSYAYYNLTTYETVMPDGRAFSKPAGGRFLTALWSASWQTPGRTYLGLYDEQGNRYETGSWTQNTLANRVIFVDGEIWTVKYQGSQFGSRLRNVVSNRGYLIQFEYQREPAPTVQSELVSWKTPAKISGGSLGHHYCDTTGTDLCPAISSAGNSANISNFASGYEVTHDSGFKKRIESSGPNQLLISTPGTNEQIGATFALGSVCDATGVISQVSRKGQSWNYSYDPCVEEERGISWTLTRTDPLGKTIQVSQLSSYSIADTYIDELGHSSSFAGGIDVGYAGFQYPEGNGVSQVHNSRNNRTSVIVTGKNGGTRSTGANFDTVCSNLITCNRPNSTKDAKGNTTLYTYDPVHGGMLTKTGPAVNGISPQTRYEYAQKYAWLKDASGSYSQAGSPIWVLMRERFCRTTAASAPGCAGGADDEVITDYDYGPNSGPNNLLMRGIAVMADGQTRRTCFSYDPMGRKISETSPRAGLTTCP